MPNPNTLAGLAENEVLYAHCECGHCAKLDKAALIERLGPDFWIPGDWRKGIPNRLLKHLRCTKCGERPYTVKGSIRVKRQGFG